MNITLKNNIFDLTADLNYEDFENNIGLIQNELIITNNFDNLKLFEGVYLGLVEKNVFQIEGKTKIERIAKYGCTNNILQRIKEHQIQYKNFTLLFFIPTPFYRQLEFYFKINNPTEPNKYNSIELIKFYSISELKNIYLRLIMIHKQMITQYKIKFKVEKWRFNYDHKNYKNNKIDKQFNLDIVYPNFDIIEFFKFKELLKDQDIDSIFN